jgi:hypothetical protein
MERQSIGNIVKSRARKVRCLGNREWQLILARAIECSLRRRANSSSNDQRWRLKKFASGRLRPIQLSCVCPSTDKSIPT